jgi:hypothetical protein
MRCRQAPFRRWDREQPRLDESVSGGTVEPMTDMDQSPEALLESDLAVFESTTGFAAAVRDALGGAGDTPLPEGSGLVFHLVLVRGEVLVCWMITATGVVLHEHLTNGDYLTVAVPAYRISRVESSRRNGEVRVVVEIDADRRGVRMAPAESGEQGFVEPAVYVLSGAGEDAEPIAAFAAELRCLLLGLWR